MINKLTSQLTAVLKSGPVVHGVKTLVLRVSGYAALLGATAIVSRSQSTEVAGAFFLALSITTILSVFGRFGLDKATVRTLGNLAETSSLKDRYLHSSAAVHMCIAISITLCAIVVLLSPWIGLVFTANPSVTTILGVMFLAIPAMSLHWVLSAIARGFEQNTEAVFFEAVSFPLLTIVFIGLCQLIWPVPSIESLGWSVVAAAVTQFAINAYRRRALIPLFVRPPKAVYGRLISIAKRMLLISSLFMLMSWTDILMLGRYGSQEDVALYVAALRIAGAIAFVLICMDPYMQMVIPRKYAAGEIGQLRLLSGRVTSLIMALSTPVFLFVVFFADWILAFFGKESVGASTTLCMLAAGYFVAAITGPVGTLLTMTNHAQTMQRIVLFSAIFNFFLNFFLIPRYGHFGAAMATAISYIVLNLSSATFVKIKLGFVVRPRLWS